MSEPAAYIALLAASAVIAAMVLLAARLNPSYRGKHDPFATPADRDDPDGDRFVARITGGQPAAAAWQATTLLEPAAERRSPELAALTRTLSGTGFLSALPDDPPPDATGEQPAAVRYLGMPSEQYVDELIAKYEGAQP